MTPDARFVKDLVPAGAAAQGQWRHERIERIMERAGDDVVPEPAGDSDDKQSCRSIDWYSEGQERAVDVGGVRVTVRFVGRRGRRARIAITAPPGAVFSAAEGKPPNGTDEPDRPR